MKKPTHKLSVQRAFSLVELLVVIAVIAVIAAIAIPNIAGITGAANTAKARRNAQNLASVSAAARAAGWTGTCGNVHAWITNLTSTSGITNSVGVFRVDGLSATEIAAATNYLSASLSSADNTNSTLIYTP